MTRVGVVTGLAAEARLIGRLVDDTGNDAPLIACAGPGRGEESAGQLIDRGAGALLSFGLAGGLDPWLKPGDLICPDRVLRADGGAIQTDTIWRGRVLAEARIAGIDMAEGALYGHGEPVAQIDAKRRLARESGAAAVDMESHAVAAIAARHGRKFIALRAVVDTADRSVPSAALAAMDPAGHIRGVAVALALLRSPGQIPAMIGLARDTRIAMRALRRSAGLGSLVLGFI